ncbi:MAG TPA: isoprenylcysteine carboxylmethyltransferase family protein [Planctomycetota bacterium]|nr:isoprenylcysteine carboxylmethyltransferase family protein [Planctomycetota bacterium]
MAATKPYPRDIPPLWLVLALLTMVALNCFCPIAVFIGKPEKYVGFVGIGASIVLMVTSARRFQRVGTGIRPFTSAKALVELGAYRFTRNPMYVGLMGSTLGTAVCLGSVSTLLVPPVLFFVLDRRFVRREEAFLREHFGTAYEDYCGRVRRWL